MTPEQYAQMHEIAEHVSELDEFKREKEISRLCAGDKVLERGIRKLLAVQSRQTVADVMSDEYIESARVQIEHLLKHPEIQDRLEIPQIESIGAFRVIREIGRGGMGVVYECEQPSPRRRVAVKVVDSLRYASSLERRLTAEARIQGRLQHPGIAQVFDAGIAQVGHSARPFFVMELINGRPMHAYADEHSLSLRKKLDLVARVADAIAHAHEHGVIHRDLKPENILVTPEGQPKVLDFGIARLVDDATLAMTTMTQEGQILGTLAYMAPEQLAKNGQEIEPAADVYALGAIAYELIVGFPPRRLTGLSIASAFHALEHDDPVSIRKQLSGTDRDVDTIVMRCLSREPERRYSTAGELADDLRLFLSKRPIQARPPTKLYKATKFVQRNRLLVAGTAATTLSLSAGLVGVTILAAGQHRARLDAQRESIRARGKELDAIRGVLAGAFTLGDSDKPWEAVEQIYTVAPESRGWEWRHLALTLPWVLETSFDRSQLHERIPATNRTFVGSTKLFQYSEQTGKGETIDVFSGGICEIPSDNLRIAHEIFMPQPIENQVGVLVEDGRIGALFIDSGSFQEYAKYDSVDQGKLFASADGRTVVQILNKYARIQHNGELVYESDSGYDPRDMSWNPPVFDPLGRWICLVRWGSPGRFVVVDTESWNEIAQADASAYGPEVVLSGDGNILYATSLERGIEAFSMPDLQSLGTLEGSDGGTRNIAISPDGTKLVYTESDTKRLVIRDLVIKGDIRKYPLGAGGLHRSPKFSTDGGLLAVHSPDFVWTWIVNTDQTDLPVITDLAGQQSWIYQLAVSPDGSLLASAAPDGEILIWDLNRDVQIALIDRAHEDVGSVLAFNMGAPLFFADSGDSLVFGEFHPDTGAQGLTRCDLRTGEREWIRAESFERTIDLAARLLEAPVGNLSPHAAKLRANRILQGTATPFYTQRVVTRRIGDPPGEETELVLSRAEIGTGVAAHPDGSVYAAGEYLCIRIRDAVTDEVLFEIPDGASTGTYNLVYSPDGQRLAIGTKSGSVMIFDTEFYKKVAEFRVPGMPVGADRNYVYNLIWTPDGKRLITCAQQSIRILESEHPRIRERERADWELDLEAARNGLGSESAARVLRIQEWAGSGTRPAPSRRE